MYSDFDDAEYIMDSAKGTNDFPPNYRFNIALKAGVELRNKKKEHCSLDSTYTGQGNLILPLVTQT